MLKESLLLYTRGGPEQGMMWQLSRQVRSNPFKKKIILIGSFYIFIHVLIQTLNFFMFIRASTFTHILIRGHIFFVIYTRVNIFTHIREPVFF